MYLLDRGRSSSGGWLAQPSVCATLNEKVYAPAACRQVLILQGRWIRASASSALKPCLMLHPPFVLNMCLRAQDVPFADRQICECRCLCVLRTIAWGVFWPATATTDAHIPDLDAQMMTAAVFATCFIRLALDSERFRAGQRLRVLPSL